MNKNRKLTPGKIIGALIRLIGLLAILGIFYGFMVYQEAPEEVSKELFETRMTLPDIALPRTGEEHLDGSDALLSIQRIEASGVRQQTISVQGTACTEVTQLYIMSDGRTVEAVTAWPRVYIEQFRESDWVPQAIAGFTIGPLNATFYLHEGGSMLAAREGEYIYLICVNGEDPDGQTVYTLGLLSEIAGRGAEN